MPKVVPAEVAAALCPENCVLDASSFKAMSQPARFTDPDYGEFEATPHQVIRENRVHRKRALAEGRNVKLTADEVQERLPPHVTLVAKTFKGCMKPATFIDAEYGKWKSTAHHVMAGHGHPERGKEKSKETCVARFQCRHPMQNRDILIKAASKKKNAHFVRHWRTQELVVAVGGYELAVVNWFNRNAIDFEWQCPVKRADGTVYFVDFLRKDSNVYLEIKGRWMDDNAKRKWREFHAEYPNSELWDYRRLVDKGIIEPRSRGGR
jgi:hypothetical protein